LNYLLFRSHFLSEIDNWGGLPAPRAKKLGLGGQLGPAKPGQAIGGVKNKGNLPDYVFCFFFLAAGNRMLFRMSR
jgi:hypothetical protein